MAPLRRRNIYICSTIYRATRRPARSPLRCAGKPLVSLHLAISQLVVLVATASAHRLHLPAPPPRQPPRPLQQYSAFAFCLSRACTSPRCPHTRSQCGIGKGAHQATRATRCRRRRRGRRGDRPRVWLLSRAPAHAVSNVHKSFCSWPHSPTPQRPRALLCSLLLLLAGPDARLCALTLLLQGMRSFPCSMRVQSRFFLL